QKGPAVGNAQPAQLQGAYRAPAEYGQIRRRLATGHHQAALMICFADGLQQPGVPGVAVSIATLALTWLEQRFKVVEHQQTAPLAEELEKRRNPRTFARGHDRPLVRQK